MLVTYKSLQDFFEEVAPSNLAEDWDNSGIQIKRDREEIEKILVGLDPSLTFIDRGIELEADLLLTHHPLLFESLDQINEASLTGKKVVKLIENDLDLYSMHTTFDHSENGLSNSLADKLNLSGAGVLKPLTEVTLLRLILYVPISYEEKLTSALLQAGVGNVGNYKNSYYRNGVNGYFEPEQGANPQADASKGGGPTRESRLEFILSPHLRNKALSVIHKIHPYEQPAYSIEKTERVDPDVGLGRTGTLERSCTLPEIIELVQESFDLLRGDFKVTGSLANPTRRIAVSPGAGGAAINPAIKSGAEVFITGELDYHERLDCYERGLVVIEIGHYNAEVSFVSLLADRLKNFSNGELDVYKYLEGTRVERQRKETT